MLLYFHSNPLWIDGRQQLVCDNGKYSIVSYLSEKYKSFLFGVLECLQNDEPTLTV